MVNILIVWDWLGWAEPQLAVAIDVTCLHRIVCSIHLQMCPYHLYYLPMAAGRQAAACTCAHICRTIQLDCKTRYADTDYLNLYQTQTNSTFCDCFELLWNEIFLQLFKAFKLKWQCGGFYKIALHEDQRESNQVHFMI